MCIYCFKYELTLTINKMASFLKRTEHKLKGIILIKFLLIKLTNRFQVSVRLFSNRSQMTSKCGKNKKVAHEAQPSVSLMFLTHFDVLCDLFLNRRTATWNLFVLYNQELKKILMMTSSIRLSSNRS